MLPVTQDFQNQIKAPVRQIHGRIKIDYTSPFLDQSIQATANEEANVSYPAQTADSVQDPPYKWASLDGSWVLDGTYHLAPGTAAEAEQLQFGWWGSTLSDAVDATFTVPYPTLTVTFFSRPIHELKVVGDSARGEYPVDFDIKLYDQADTILHTETITGNTQVAWTKTLASSVNQVVKMTLEIQKWSHPGRQVKILEFFTSIQETYEGDDILLINLLEERDVSQGSLPVGNISANEIEVRLNNINHKFDAGNTQSPLYQLLKANRRIRAWLGIEAENIDSQNPPTFTRPSPAYKQDGTQVAADQPRFEASLFSQGLMFEEGTDNLVKTNAGATADFSDSVGWALTGSGASIANGVATLQSPDGVAYSMVRCTLTNLAQNIPHSFLIRARYKDETGTASNLNVDLYAAGYDNVEQQFTIIPSQLTTSFQNFTKNGFDSQSVPSSVSLRIYTYSTRPIEVEFIQLEQKPYATTFTDGTRTDEELDIPSTAINKAVCTLEAQVYVTDVVKRTTASNWPTVFLVRFGLAVSDWIWVRHNPAGVWRLQIRDETGAVTAQGDFPDTDIPNGWHNFALRWDEVAQTADLLVDGVPKIQLTGVKFTSNNYDRVNIGYRKGGPNDHLNSYIDDLRISSRARTDQEILDAYNSGAPLPVDEYTTYKLTFNGSIYPVEKCWIPLGTFWSGDWNVPENEIWAHTSGRDRLELLRKSTYSVSQVMQNTTLYDMAIAVLQDAGLAVEEYWVDTELQNYPVPYAWFDPVSHREALRRIAEACLGQVYCDRNGIVRVEGPSFLAGQTTSQLTITRDDYFPEGKDHPVKWSEIANYIEVETQPLRPVSTPEEVYRSNDPVSINAGETKSLTVFYNEPPVIEAVASLEGQGANTTITNATYYAWGATIEITNAGASADTFTLVINGKPLKVLNKEKAIAQDDASITDNGKLRYKFPDNPFIQTLAVAQDIADKLLAAFKDPRRDISLEWRGNPALELADKITANDYLDQNTADYHVIRQTLEFDGGLRSRVDGRKA